MPLGPGHCWGIAWAGVLQQSGPRSPWVSLRWAGSHPAGTRGGALGSEGRLTARGSACWPVRLLLQEAPRELCWWTVRNGLAVQPGDRSPLTQV